MDVQVEGNDKQYIYERYPNGVIDLTNMNWMGIRAFDWTDDTDQLILIMEAFTNKLNMVVSSLVLLS